MCRKTRARGNRADPATFRVTRGQDNTRHHDRQGNRIFAHAVCGILPFAQGTIPELGGASVNVQIAALDDVPVADQIAAPSPGAAA
jgi:hypothetical protein